MNTDQVGENSAYAIGRNLNISFKEASEVCRFIRNKSVKKAIHLLESVVKEKIAVPITRYNDDLGHKPGTGSARWPIKCASEILIIVKSAQNNAQNKGLSTHHLIITHILANKASTPFRYGRKRRRKAKRSHVEIIVTENKKEEDKK